MLKHLVPFRETRQLATLTLDYLDQKETLVPFYHRFPALENFKLQAEEKAHQKIDRKVLVEVLHEQYAGLKCSKATKKNIDALHDEKTFTVTTGHQLNLTTGPLYFIYKILSTINLAEKLNVENPDLKIVPVYWMATEDHDFDEIDHFVFQGHKITWERDGGGKVGTLKTGGIEGVFEALKKYSNGAWHIDELVELFQWAYTQHPTLATATRALVNELFKDYGLVIVDADHTSLKRSLIPVMQQDIFEQTPHKNIATTNARLEEMGYNIQVNPREINFFYMGEGFRERIVQTEEGWQVLETSIHWNKEELLSEIENYPERFSPNVVLRPLYQELILPNLAYLGGGAEVAYWLELKAVFDHFEVPYPMVMLRNMVMVLNATAVKKLEQLSIPIASVFKPKDALTRQLVTEHASIEIDLSKERYELRQLNEMLRKKAAEIDITLQPAVEAELTRRVKGLDRLEKKFIRAEKHKQTDLLNRIDALYEAVFPKGKVQERFENYSTLYANWGRSFIQDVKSQLDPLDFQMILLSK